VSIPLGDGRSLTTRTTSDKGEAPKIYSLDVTLPFIDGAPSAGTIGFNQAVKDEVDGDIQDFLLNVADLWLDSRPGSPGSFEGINYSVSSANSRVISLYIDVSGYMEGAAHPYHYSRAFNYDLMDARALSLDDLFTPGADYLSRIAAICSSTLESKLDDGFMFRDGAEPTMSNYRNWNLERDSLLIQFNEYQVAPYVVGPQRVTIPYSALDDLLRSDARLAAVRTP